MRSTRCGPRWARRPRCSTPSATTAGSVADAVRRLGRPALAPVVDELVRRFETGVDPVRLTLHDMSAPTRAAVADLLGLDRLPAPGARLPVTRLLTGLGLASTDQLRCVVASLRGPLTDRSAERVAATFVLADVQALADTAANGLHADLRGAPEVVHGRSPGGVDGGAVLVAERFGVGAHPVRPDVEVAGARGPREASDHGGVADELCRPRVRHGAQHAVERRGGRDSDCPHRRRRGDVEQRRAGVRRLAGLEDCEQGRTPLDPDARSARTCHRHARQASVTNWSQSQMYTPRTPLDPPELNTCKPVAV